MNTAECLITPLRQDSVKHELVAFTKVNDGRYLKKWIGEAFYYPEHDYFKLQLSVFPFPYYVTKNKDSDCRYTVWAQRLGDSDTFNFRRPVGDGFLTVVKHSSGKLISNHVELEIPLLALKSNPMLCLFPSH